MVMVMMMFMVMVVVMFMVMVVVMMVLVGVLHTVVGMGMGMNALVIVMIVMHSNYLPFGNIDLTVLYSKIRVLSSPPWGYAEKKRSRTVGKTARDLNVICV